MYIKKYINVLIFDLVSFITITLLCFMFEYYNVVFLFFLCASLLFGTTSIFEKRNIQLFAEYYFQKTGLDSEGPVKFKKGVSSVGLILAVLCLILAVIFLFRYTG